MTGYIYIDRHGLRMNKQVWEERQADPAYRIVSEFDNGVVQVRLIWNGRITKAQSQQFRDTWPIFELRVMNYNAEGRLVPDPVADNETFSDFESAVDAYEEFLIVWANCERKDDGSFVEVDNNLAPPPPPDPDAPTSVLKDAPEDFGTAW